MKLKITGRALPKHQQKLQVNPSSGNNTSFPLFQGSFKPQFRGVNGNIIDTSDPNAMLQDWLQRQPGYFDFNKTSLFPKPQGLRDLNGNLIPGTTSTVNWGINQNGQITKNGLVTNSNSNQKNKSNKLTGYEQAALAVGSMGVANNILNQSEYQKQLEQAKRYGYTDSAYESYTPSFSRGYQETNRKNPATNYSYPQFAGTTVAPLYGYAQEGGVLMPDEPMGAYEMDVFNQMPNVDLPNVKESVNLPSKNSYSKSSSGVNPLAEQTWRDVSSEYQGLKNLGIWGDAKHRKSVSDHNTGDALDIGITNFEQGNAIAQKMINEAKDRNVKYIIWNKQIWNPSISNTWRPYNGSNPHTNHVHVSFNSDFQPPTKIDPNAGQISFTHNNPLNLHYGDYAKRYGGEKGSPDGDGYVAIFKDLNTGLKANTDKLFGPDYNNLPISKARNRWVTGSADRPTPSSKDIVKEMGKDVPLAQLTPKEKEKLFKLFARFEGKQAYNLIKDMPVFEEGGEYELDDEQIQQILKNGGRIEYL